MGKILRHEWGSNIWLRILTITSILLIVASFIIPPYGILDPSVLAAVGELEVFGALWIVYHAVDKGTNATIRKGDVEMEIKEKESHE